MSDINFSIVQLEGKPIEKLIETVSSAIGTLYNPYRIRRDAKAEADRTVIMANAKAQELLILGDAENELAKRAAQRFIAQEINRQKNVEEIADVSVRHLAAEVSDTPISEEWSQNFFNKAQNISNADLQELWGKLLSREVNQSGSVTPEALELLATLTPSEARLFEKAGTLLFSGSYLIPYGSPLYSEDKSIHYPQIIELQDLGLIHNNMMNLTFFPQKTGESFLNFNDKILSIQILNELKTPVYSLTNRAKSLLQALEIPSDLDYIHYIINNLVSNGYIAVSKK